MNSAADSINKASTNSSLKSNEREWRSPRPCPNMMILILGLINYSRRQKEIEKKCDKVWISVNLYFISHSLLFRAGYFVHNGIHKESQTTLMYNGPMQTQHSLSFTMYQDGWMDGHRTINRPLGIIRFYLTFLSKLSYSHILIL